MRCVATRNGWTSASHGSSIKAPNCSREAAERGRSWYTSARMNILIFRSVLESGSATPLLWCLCCVLLTKQTKITEYWHRRPVSQGSVYYRSNTDVCVESCLWPVLLLIFLWCYSTTHGPKSLRIADPHILLHCSCNKHEACDKHACILSCCAYDVTHLTDYVLWNW